MEGSGEGGIVLSEWVGDDVEDPDKGQGCRLGKVAPAPLVVIGVGRLLPLSGLGLGGREGEEVWDVGGSCLVLQWQKWQEACLKEGKQRLHNRQDVRESISLMGCRGRSKVNFDRFVTLLGRSGSIPPGKF